VEGLNLTDKSDGGPAFPMIVWKSPDGMLAAPSEPGMSLRDWFAGHALTGIGTWCPPMEKRIKVGEIWKN
jgi:hypothetical protein